MNPYKLGKFDILQDKVWYARATFGEEEKAAVRKCLDEFQLSPGKYTFEFEEKVAELFGKKYGVMVNSGSSALILAAELLNIEKGDEIVTAASGFPTTITPFLNKGAKVVLVDVEPYTLQPRIDQLESAITPKTKAIIVAHIWGALNNMPYLRELSDRYGVKLIEDSCDSIGQTIDGKPSGTWADISVTSFFPSHVITAGGGGGMIMVDTEKEANRLRVFRDWGRTGTDSEELEDRFGVDLDGIPYDAKFFYGELGYNLKATEMQAAFGLEQLKKLKGWNALRAQHYARLSEVIESPVTCGVEKAKPSWLAFPFFAKNRRELATYLEERGIQTRPILAGNFTRHPAFKKANLRYNRLPGADYVAQNGIGIGLHQALTKDQLDHVERTIDEFYRFGGNPNLGIK